MVISSEDEVEGRADDLHAAAGLEETSLDVAERPERARVQRHAVVLDFDRRVPREIPACADRGSRLPRDRAQLLVEDRVQLRRSAAQFAALRSLLAAYRPRGEVRLDEHSSQCSGFRLMS